MKKWKNLTSKLTTLVIYSIKSNAIIGFFNILYNKYLLLSLFSASNNSMSTLAKFVGKTINTLGYIAPNLTGQLMINLFCRPSEGSTFTPKEKAFLDTAIQTTLTFNHKKIQCYTWGKGSKKIFLAHGFNSNASRWRPLVNLLIRSGYHILAIDAPAHGKSDWKMVNGLLYAQVVQVVMNHFQPKYVIGHSFACMAFAYYFSKMESQQVEKIILMGVPNKLDDITKIFFKELDLNHHAQHNYYKAFKNKFGYEVEYFTLSKLFKEVPYPSLIINDEKDEITPIEGAIVLHKNWKNSIFFPTNNLGHSLQGRAVYKETMRFLEA